MALPGASVLAEVARHRPALRSWAPIVVRSGYWTPCATPCPAARVEISARVDGDKAIVSIANTGPVIPPEQVHRLFDPFQRLDRTRVDDPPRPRTVHRPRHRHRPRHHAHRERATAGWPPDRDPLPAHTVRNATVGGIREAPTAGIRPAA